MVDLLDEQRLVEQLRHVEQCPGATDRAQRGLGAAMGFFLASEMLTAISASTRRSISRPDQRGVSVEVAANVLDWLFSSCLTRLEGTRRRHPRHCAATGSQNSSCSNNLKQKTLAVNRKRAAGIEPASSAWKAEVLPLNYARISTNALQLYAWTSPPKVQDQAESL